MLLFILAVVIFVVADFLLRLALKRWQETRQREKREAALQTSLTLDFSWEAKSLKRVTVENPKSRILCVDDEDVVLDSFRKILVLDGYSVDTVSTGQEALALIQSHHYDFVFTDLKMPEMNGEEVTKSVKHLRPDIDIIVITGYATVESAVECMKQGAMDYIQKPFTEDELVGMVEKFVIRRKDRIQRDLKPRVHVTKLPGPGHLPSDEFYIPGGVFISEGHCWVRMEEDGTVKVGIDDFARKLLGRIDAVEPPNLGMAIGRGQPLFSVKQGYRSVPFRSPVSGRIAKVNARMKVDTEALEVTPYEGNWICAIDAEDLDTELQYLKIGKTAVSFYQDELDHAQELAAKSKGNGAGHQSDGGRLSGGKGVAPGLTDSQWEAMVKEFFVK